MVSVINELKLSKAHLALQSDNQKITLSKTKTPKVFGALTLGRSELQKYSVDIVECCYGVQNPLNALGVPRK
jgi:hypothetical protein